MLSQLQRSTRPSRLSGYQLDVLAAGGVAGDARLTIAAQLIDRYGAAAVARHRQRIARLLGAADQEVTGLLERKARIGFEQSQLRTVAALDDFATQLFNLASDVVQRVDSLRPEHRSLVLALIGRLSALRADVSSSSRGVRA